MRKFSLMYLLCLSFLFTAAAAKDAAINKHIFELQPDLISQDINAFSLSITNLAKQGFGVVLSPRPETGGTVADQPKVMGFYLLPKKTNCDTNLNQMRYTCDIEKAFMKYDEIPVAPVNAVKGIKYIEDIIAANEVVTSEKIDQIVSAALALIQDDKYAGVTIGKIGTVLINTAGNLQVRCPYTIPEEVVDLTCQEVFNGAVQIESAEEVPDGSILTYTPTGNGEAGGTMTLTIGDQTGVATEIPKNGVYQVTLNGAVLEVDVNLIGKLPEEPAQFVISERAQ